MRYYGLDVPNNRVIVEVACNDPDNGTFAYRAEQIQIGHQLIELEAKRELAPRFVELLSAFRLAGKKWPHYGGPTWFGNWCWNGYWMDIPTAVDFLAWLHQRNLFNLTCGEERIFNRWKWREPFDKSHLDFLDRQLCKPSNWAG
jgi:hypothetical protein